MMIHATQRAFQRFPNTCAPKLIREIACDVESGDREVAQFVGMMANNPFNGLYFFKCSDGVSGYAIVSEATKFVITVLSCSGTIRLSRGTFNLGPDGLETIQ